MSVINGTKFDDSMSATFRPGDILKGLAGNDSFEFYGFSQQDRFVGGFGHDMLVGVEIATDVEGFATQAQGTTFVGGKGMDTVEFSITTDLPTLKLGAFGMTLKGVEFRAYDIELTGIDTSAGDIFRVVGRDAAETVTLLGRNLDSDISTLSIRLNGGNDKLQVEAGSLDHIFINTGSGRDTVVMSYAVDGTVINLGGGSDRIVLDGYARETVNGGKGSDTFVLDHALWTVHTDTVKTGGGRDKIIVGGAPIVTAPLGNVADFNSKRDKIGLAIDGNGSKPFDVVFSLEELASERASNPDAYRTEYWLMDNEAGTLGYIYNGNVREILDFGGATDLSERNFFRVDENFGSDFLL